MEKLFVFLIIMALLVGCVPVKAEVPSETPLPTAVLTPELTKRLIESRCSRIDYCFSGIFCESFHAKDIVITSTETLDKIEETIIKGCRGDKIELMEYEDKIDFLNHYADSMFKEDGLVLIASYQSWHSRSPEYTVESVVADDKTIEIELCRNLHET